MGGMGPNMNSMGGQGLMGGGPSGPGPQPHPQMNGTTASAIHALPASLPGQSSSSALTQKLAGTQDADMRRTMLGKWVTHVPSVGRYAFLGTCLGIAVTTSPAVLLSPFLFCWDFQITLSQSDEVGSPLFARIM